MKGGHEVPIMRRLSTLSSCYVLIVCAVLLLAVTQADPILSSTKESVTPTVTPTVTPSVTPTEDDLTATPTVTSIPSTEPKGFNDWLPSIKPYKSVNHSSPFGGLEVMDLRGAHGSPFILRDPTYLVVAPRLVRAGQVYRLVVNILEPSPSLIVRATIFRNNIDLAAVEHECESRAPQVLELMVPRGSNSGQYRLRLEGNEIGGLTGSAFTNETALTFTPRGATVLVQTDKPLYTASDVVRFRVVALDTAVKMVEDSVDVFILNPRGVLVRRWLSRQCREGPVSLDFQLSLEPEYGDWKIRVEATNSFVEHQFIVEEYHQPRFEVEVRVPSWLSSSSTYLEGVVVANYTSGAPIAGNVTVRAAVRPLYHTQNNYHQYKGPEPALTHPHTMFSGVFPFKFRISDFEDLIGHTEGSEVRVTAIVGDAYWDASHTGFASTRIYSSSIKLQFLGESPHVFRSAMPFKFYLTAEERDGSRVPQWRLYRHRLMVSPEVTLVSGERKKLLSRTVKMTHNIYSLWVAEIDLHSELADVEVEVEVTSIRLEAELKDSSGSRSFASLISVAHHSPRGRHLQVTTSTKHPKVGEYIILHVRSNFYLSKFRYILLSKGMVIEAGQQHMEASLKTFPLPLTAELAGVATVVIYAAGRDEDLVADALTFAVDALTRKGLDVSVNPDPLQENLMLTVTAQPGSRVALSGTHWASYRMQAGNDFTHTKILSQMSRDAGGSEQSPLEQIWVSQYGFPEDILHLPRASPGVDPNTTFSYSDLLVLSDGVVPTVGRRCGGSASSRHPCLLSGCFPDSAKCDGKFDCPDRIDERGCKLAASIQDDATKFRLYGSSRLRRHFTKPWVWREVLVGETGVSTVTVPLPPGSSQLALTAYSLHPEYGMTILPKPVKWQGSRGFWISVEAPSKANMWEQVGVRVTAVNHKRYPVGAIIVLANNPKYKFVNVEGFEVTDPSSGHIQRRMVGGEHEHQVEVEAGETHTLYLPIVPIELGPITVIVQASLINNRKLQEEVTILVEPMGAVQEFHTSLMLDLSNRAYFFTFLDVNVSEGAVEKSHSAHVSVFGGPVAPAFPDSPVTPDLVLGLPTVGCEPVVFSFLMTVLQMRHYKEMSQQPPLSDRNIFKKLGLLYQTLLAYQTRDGGFKYYRTSQTSSVWVTSLALRALNEVSVNWSHFLYVDPQVTDKALKFLLTHQASHGAWWEPSGEVGDRKLIPSPYSLTGETTRALNLSSTAHTMINLLALQGLPSPLDEQVLMATARGSRWLEENLPVVGDVSRPLEVSLVALALHMTDSTQADAAFSIVTRNARQEIKYVYWGEDLVPLPSYRVESQRPHLQPRQPHRHDAGNVAATSYALRLYAARGEVMTPSIIRWLHSQRAHDGGWISTQDTLAAWEALYEYSSNDRRGRDTQLAITVEPLHDHTRARTFHISPDNILQLQKQSVNQWWSSVRVQGKGRGAAVLQLTSKYNVADPSRLVSAPTPAFQLRTRATWHGHNGSSLTFISCSKWLFKETSDASGVAVLEITIPTGYGASSEALQQYVSSRTVPHLRRADFKDRTLTFFFEKLVATDTCIEFSVERWFPVANLTKVLPVKVYEYYSPELYEVELLDMSSVSLDICQVCGSYQCPNCPILSYYSSQSQSLFSHNSILTTLCLLLLSQVSLKFIS